MLEHMAALFSVCEGTSILFSLVAVQIYIHTECEGSLFSTPHVPLVHLYVSFGEMSLQIFHPFFDWVLCFIDIELHKLFVYFGD